MEFQLTVVINRPLQEVFAFLRDIEQHTGRKGTVVPVYDKVTPGSVGVGTRYREVVQVLPFVEIVTEVIRYEPGRRLAYRYVALGMAGELTYLFEAVEGGTRLVQQQSLGPSGILRLCSPVIEAMFSRMIERRLMGIKSLLESGTLAC